MDNIKKSGELSEEQLEQASGGYGGDIGHQVAVDESIRWDSRGNATHWQPCFRGSPYQNPYHYVCSHCGRLLHEGTFGRLYCDPCDESWFRITIPSSCKHEGFYPGC